jgi:uncharacterized protein YeaO (DUF488 family)
MMTGTISLSDLSGPGMPAIKRAGVNVWLRYLGPSPGLYELYASKSITWESFVARYHGEQVRNREYFRDLQDHNHNGGLTLLQGSRNNDHNVAAALKMLPGQDNREILRKRDQESTGQFPGNDSTSQVLTQKMQ